jgi:CRISPR-associated exonuclease Cas4
MSVFSEDDLLPISALQHLAYCPRQCALIHLERVWSENLYTAEGKLLHAKADAGRCETKGDVVTARGVRLHSFSLGLSGIADVVEFRRSETEGCPLAGRHGLWLPHPVEYKRGRPKKHDCDQVQLCAQAICLEEMLGVTIEEGSLFYGKTRRRKPVVLDEALRARTHTLAEELHRLWMTGRTPPPEYGEKCENCSLQPQCLPQLSHHGEVEAYLHQVFDEGDGS